MPAGHGAMFRWTRPVPTLRRADSA
jgi:hypothetical protein